MTERLARRRAAQARYVECHPERRRSTVRKYNASPKARAAKRRYLADGGAMVDVLYRYSNRRRLLNRLAKQRSEARICG